MRFFIKASSGYQLCDIVSSALYLIKFFTFQDETIYIYIYIYIYLHVATTKKVTKLLSFFLLKIELLKQESNFCDILNRKSGAEETAFPCSKTSQVKPFMKRSKYCKAIYTLILW